MARNFCISTLSVSHRLASEAGDGWVTAKCGTRAKDPSGPMLPRVTCPDCRQATKAPVRVSTDTR